MRIAMLVALFCLMVEASGQVKFSTVVTGDIGVVETLESAGMESLARSSSEPCGPHFSLHGQDSSKGGLVVFAFTKVIVVDAEPRLAQLQVRTDHLQVLVVQERIAPRVVVLDAGGNGTLPSAQLTITQGTLDRAPCLRHAYVMYKV